MNSLDFLFYSLFPDPNDSRSRSVSIMTLWMWMLISGIFLAISILYRNSLADLYVSSPWPSMILAGIIYSSIILRYCFLISYESLVAKRQKIKHIWIYYIINALILIGAPILSFVAFRLYLYGHV